MLVTSDDKDGKDAGELAGIPPLGVAATTSIDDVLALEADAVNYAPLYADVDDMARILRSGKNIVTPVGFVYPKALDPAVVAKLEAACQAGGTSLHGAGIHPGFSGDLLPLTASRLCTRIDQVIVQEVADLAPHPSYKMNFEGLGFGRDPDDARANPSPLIHTMESIFKESMLLLADGLGVTVDEVTTEFDVAVAKRDLTVRSGADPQGHRRRHAPSVDHLVRRPTGHRVPQFLEDGRRPRPQLGVRHGQVLRDHRRRPLDEVRIRADLASTRPATRATGAGSGRR